MRLRFSDALLAVIIFILPLTAMIQACGGKDPLVPNLPPNEGSNDPHRGTAPPGMNHAPTAVLSVVGPEEGPTPFTVYLDGSASTDPDGDSLFYEWVFSDGQIATESVVSHEFTFSGRQSAMLIVSDGAGLADDAGPVDLWAWGLANSAWPKFAHDQRNSGTSPYEGPMKDYENASAGHPFGREWTGGITNDTVNAVCIGYGGKVFYTQGSWLRARTADGGLLWDYEAESEITAWPAIMYDGSIVFGTRSGWVQRISETGDIVWQTDLRAETGMRVVLLSAVNIGNDGSIYVGGYVDQNPITEHLVGGLAAVSIDGTVLWSKPVPGFAGGAFSSMDPAPIVPAIAENGNVVVNGEGGRMFSPDGTEVAKLEYMWTIGGGVPHPAPLGPPTINADGFILFTNRAMPLFRPDGVFFTVLFPLEDYYWTTYDVGFWQAPLWSYRTMDLLHTSSQENDYFLSTRLLEGGVWTEEIGHNPFYDYSVTPLPSLAGATRDSMGRIYVSSFKLFVASSLIPYSAYPYSRRRSLWTYGSARHMTPPAIGEDTWLYVGYGDDLLAIAE